LARLRNPSLKHLHTFRVDVTWPEFPVERERRMVEMADQLTAVSEHTARTAEKVYDVSPEVIYNGVDATEFHPRYERPDLFDRRDIESPLFVFVGRFEPRKHPQDVVEVARAVPEAEFLLFGDGPLFEEVTEESSSLDNVHLLGRVPKATLPAVYANANGLVFPTVHEGCPNVVLEAMASATPVVGYTATSMPELVSEGETGYLADPEDVSGLVERTRRLLDADTAATLGRNARRYVENEHDFEAIAKQYERLYLELLE
jgi:glycosyltransferase involved in cell wall biosynthesis